MHSVDAFKRVDNRRWRKRAGCPRCLSPAARFNPADARRDEPHASVRWLYVVTAPVYPLPDGAVDERAALEDKIVQQAVVTILNEIYVRSWAFMCLLDGWLKALRLKRRPLDDRLNYCGTQMSPPPGFAAN
jgi:hypothetical protein